MSQKPKFIIDDNIPYLIERLDGLADITVLPPDRIDAKAVHDADALLIRTRTKCNASLLEGSKVRVVVTATIGLDHIDVRWCADNGIHTYNAAGCNSPAVAQYVVASLSKAGFDPATDTLGIVGKGHIGSIVAEIVRGAGGKVLVCDPPRAKNGYMDERYLPLKTLLREADAVTFHVPLSKLGKHPTYHLLDSSNVSLLKDDAIVINASRGGVIDEKAVLASTSKSRKWIIDTWENEPALDKNFLDLAFISTPHIAGYSQEGKERASRRAIEILNNHFGLDISTEGLADYDFDPHAHTFAEIAESYDPFVDSALLRSNPDKLETLRDTYNFRPEPSL